MPAVAQKNEQDNKGAVQDPLPTPRAKKPTGEKPPKWQDRLLPVMTGLLVGLTLFFFVSTFFSDVLFESEHFGDAGCRHRL
jgi:hypothetical protein